MQTVKNAAASAKETAANVAASAKSGVDKSKAVAQEKVEKMKAQDPMEKHIATVKKLDKIQLAEVNKQEARHHNAAVKRASVSTTAPTQPPSTTCITTRPAV